MAPGTQHARDMPMMIDVGESLHEGLRRGKSLEVFVAAR